MLHRLVGGAVFAQTDGVVGEHMDHALLHQRCHADGVAAVIAEGQEGAAVGDVAAVQGHTVHDGGHAKFAHTVVDVAANVVVRAAQAFGQGVLDHLALRVHAEAGGGWGIGEVGAGQVGAATQKLGQGGGERGQRQLAGLAAGHGFCFLVGGHHSIHHGLVKVLGQDAGHAAQKLGSQGGVGGLVRREQGVPFSLVLRALGHCAPCLVHRVGNDKGRVVPVQRLACQHDFLGAQRLAVGLGSTRAVGAALANMGSANDEGGLGGGIAFLRFILSFSAGNGVTHRRGVVAINGPQHIPTAGHKTQGGVVGKPRGDLAVNRNAVVVVQRHQLAQLPGAR